MGWTTGVQFLTGKMMGFFLFATASRPALRPNHLPRAFTPGAKRQECEADHLPPSSAEVKSAWNCISTHQYVFVSWCLVKHRDNFIFYAGFLIVNCTEKGTYMRR
jgi:hypothetical protein